MTEGDCTGNLDPHRWYAVPGLVDGSAISSPKSRTSSLVVNKDVSEMARTHEDRENEEQTIDRMVDAMVSVLQLKTSRSPTASETDDRCCTGLLVIVALVSLVAVIYIRLDLRLTSGGRNVYLLPLRHVSTAELPQ